jgi:hypothetical protein
MNPGYVVAITWGGGVIGAFFVAGATRAKLWDFDFPTVALFQCLAWPLALPLVLGRALAKRMDRRRLAAKERQKWLEAPLP